MMKNNLFLTTIVFFYFLTNVYAENGHFDLKFLSEYVSSVDSTLNSSSTQNLSGFGIEVYKKFKKESDGENNVSYIDNYIEKSSREKKLEEKLYKERQKGAKPKTIEMWENRLSKEREKRNKLMAKRRGSDGSKIGVGIIMGYKYLDGSLIVNGGGTTSVEKNYAEIGIRINW
jgi:NADH dehydrogenase/NADH:ubiquinone oxidoreductase subunit G